jgi:hypothetical protein
LSNIESAAKIEQWSDPDKREIAYLKLTDSAKLYQGCTELQAEGTTWLSFKDAFRRRYEEVHTNQYLFTKLQTATKKANLRKFADNCRGFAQKISFKTNDPVAQRIHPENGTNAFSEFRVGFSWEPGNSGANSKCSTYFESVTNSDFSSGSRKSRAVNQFLHYG